MTNPSFNEIMNGLDGGITSEEGALLRRLASQVDSGCIVEVGSYRGKSAVALATGVQDREIQPRPSIYCIEPHRPFTDFYGGKFGPQDRGVFYDVMLRTGVFNDVSLVNLSSQDVTSGWREPVGLLFLAGDHRYEGVSHDFEHWDPHVIPGGLIAFDDAQDVACGPFQLIREILRSGRYRETEATGKIVVLRKNAILSDFQKTAFAGRKRLLVVCGALVLSGGLLRFERVGRVLRAWGHEVAFVSLADQSTPQRDVSLPVLSFDEASASHWDAVMAPGAGFPSTVMDRFGLFNQEHFGIRVPHLLNDQSQRENFLRLNRSFLLISLSLTILHGPLGRSQIFRRNASMC